MVDTGTSVKIYQFLKKLKCCHLKLHFSWSPVGARLSCHWCDFLSSNFYAYLTCTNYILFMPVVVIFYYVLLFLETRNHRYRCKRESNKTSHKCSGKVWFTHVFTCTCIYMYVFVVFWCSKCCILYCKYYKLYWLNYFILLPLNIWTGQVTVL